MTIGLIGSTPNQYVNASNGFNTSPFNTAAYYNTNGTSSITNPFVFEPEISTYANQRQNVLGNSRGAPGDMYAPAHSAIMPSASLSPPVAFAPAMQQSQACIASMPIPQPQQSSGEAENLSMGVESFRGILTTNSRAEAAPGVNNIKLVFQDGTQRAPGDSRSNMDAFSVSRPPTFEPLRKDQLEKPWTSNERAVSEGEDELGLLHTVVRPERTPQALVLSAQKFDKSIPARIPRKGSVLGSPVSLHSSRGNSIRPDQSFIGSISGEERRPSDLNKPLPLPPDLVNLDEPEQPIVFNERVFDGSTDEKRILSSPVRQNPKPSLGHRSSSLKSSADRPVSELYKSLRSPKPSDELFDNLSPDIGMEGTPKAPSTPPSHKPSSSGPAKLTSSFSTMHIIDQYSSPQDKELPRSDNPFSVFPTRKDKSSHPLKSSPSLSSLLPSGRIRRLLSSPINTTTCTSSTPVSASTSTTASPSTAATSTAHSPEIGTATPPMTPATKFPISIISLSSSAAKAAKPPPVPPPRRTSSSRKKSDLGTHLTLMQAKRAGTDPHPQVPQFQRSEHQSPSDSSPSHLASLANASLPHQRRNDEAAAHMI